MVRVIMSMVRVVMVIMCRVLAMVWGIVITLRMILELMIVVLLVSAKPQVLKVLAMMVRVIVGRTMLVAWTAVTVLKTLATAQTTLPA
jgi:hypothetical protein